MDGAMKNNTFLEMMTNRMMTNNSWMPMDVVVEEAPYWVTIFDEFQFSINIIGIIANLMTMITLAKNGDGFSPIIALILKYQSLVDAVNCILTTLIFRLPFIMETGYNWLDVTLCHIWTTQHLYWTGTFMSIWNLVTLAIERYICVCHALKYINLTKKKVWMVFLFFFMMAAVYLLPGVFQTNMHKGKCENVLFWDGQVAQVFFFIWVLSAFFAFYAIPTVLFIIFYGLVIRSFRQRAKANLGATSAAAVIDKASSELTKTAVVVTVIFTLAYSYTFWQFILKYSGVIDYTMMSAERKVGTLLATINLVANPFVYASLLPAYRRSVIKTYFSSCQK